MNDRISSVAKRRALSLVLVALFAVLGTATAGGGDQSAAGGGTGTANVSAMEGHFSHGTAWGEGPDAQDMAQTIIAELEPGDTVAVRVIPGTPRRVVALIKYGDAAAEGLADLDDATRRQHLDSLIAMLDNLYETGDAQLGLGIRGTIFYGAVATRQPGGATQHQVGAVVSTDALEAILAAPATPPTPPMTIAVGQTVSGQCAAPPMPTPRYLLTLAAPTNLMTGVSSVGFSGEQMPFAVICRGDLPIRQCQDETTIVAPDFDENGNPIYRLAPGPYSVFMVGGEDCGGAVPCPPLTAPFQLTLTAAP